MPFGCVGAVRRVQRTYVYNQLRCAQVKDWNAGIIREFRENGGVVGGQFAGAPLNSATRGQKAASRARRRWPMTPMATTS